MLKRITKIPYKADNADDEIYTDIGAMQREIFIQGADVQLAADLKESLREKQEIFEDGDEVIAAMVNFYIPNKGNQTRAFELWGIFKKKYLGESR